MLNIISTRGQSDTKIMKCSFPKLPNIPLFLVASVVILVSARKSSAHTYLSPPWEQARLKARVGRFHSIFNPIFITVDNSPPEWCCSSRLRKQMYNNSGHCIAKPAQLLDTAPLFAQTVLTRLPRLCFVEDLRNWWWYGSLTSAGNIWCREFPRPKILYYQLYPL